MSRRFLIIGGVGVVAVVALAVGAWFLFFSDDAPEAVTNEAANEQLDADLAAADENGAATEDETAADAPTADDPAPADPIDADPIDTPAGIEGEWTVDTSIGEFDFDSASGSFAGFRVDEELTIGEVTAVGRTGDVSGSLTVEGEQITATEVTVDLTAVASNDSRRENAIRGALDTSTFPEATFVLTEAIALPPGIDEGETVEVQAVGELTIHGVTNAATFDLTANVRDDGIAVVTGSAAVVFADYDVTPPSAPVVVSVEDNGIIEFQLLLTQTVAAR